MDWMQDYFSDLFGSGGPKPAAPMGGAPKPMTPPMPMHKPALPTPAPGVGMGATPLDKADPAMGEGPAEPGVPGSGQQILPGVSAPTFPGASGTEGGVAGDGSVATQMQHAMPPTPGQTPLNQISAGHPLGQPTYRNPLSGAVAPGPTSGGMTMNPGAALPAVRSPLAPPPAPAASPPANVPPAPPAPPGPGGAMNENGGLLDKLKQLFGGPAGVAMASGPGAAPPGGGFDPGVAGKALGLGPSGPGGGSAGLAQMLSGTGGGSPALPAPAPVAAAAPVGAPGAPVGPAAAPGLMDRLSTGSGPLLQRAFPDNKFLKTAGPVLGDIAAGMKGAGQQRSGIAAVSQGFGGATEARRNREENAEDRAYAKTKQGWETEEHGWKKDDRPMDIQAKKAELLGQGADIMNKLSPKAKDAMERTVDKWLAGDELNEREQKVIDVWEAHHRGKKAKSEDSVFGDEPGAEAPSASPPASRGITPPGSPPAKQPDMQNRAVTPPAPARKPAPTPAPAAPAGSETPVAGAKLPAPPQGMKAPKTQEEFAAIPKGELFYNWATNTVLPR